MRQPTQPHTLILYDGVCGLCDGVVRFLLRRDRDDAFRFAPLQSEAARVILQRHGMDAARVQSVCAVADYTTDRERVLTRSDAVLYALGQLGRGRRLSVVANLAPRVLRDALYDLVARYRYRVFGKLPACPVPEPGDREKFVDFDASRDGRAT